MKGIGDAGSESRAMLAEALGHQAAGRAAAAEALYRAVLQRDPGNADALHLLGMLACTQGKVGEAVELIRAAIARHPDVAEFHNSLGTVLGARGQSVDAERAFRRAIAINPEYAEARRNLGLSLQRQGRVEEAVLTFRSAARARAGYVDALSNLGAALRGLGRVAETVEVEWELLERTGGTPQAWLALGLSLRELRRLDEATVMLRRAVALAPADALSHFNLALVLLEAGRFEEGFREYEWRWGLPDFVNRRAKFAQPLWDGTPLGGRRILLHTEQGLGTNIQFVRYVPRVWDRGGEVVLACPPSLARLFQTVRGVSQVIEAGQPLPAFDVHAPLASLPLLLGTRPETIPADVPYLSAEAARVERWRTTITRDPAHLNVGLVWAGNPKPDPARSCSFDDLAPLAGVRGVRIFSLQKGEAGGQLKGRSGMRVDDLSAGLHDFAETAAAVACLDLVVSIDTSVAHLAGALGKPVWTLLPYLADWRWGIGREDSRWYPTMRLFQQAKQGEWGQVVARVAVELERLRCSADDLAGRV